MSSFIIKRQRVPKGYSVGQPGHKVEQGFVSPQDIKVLLIIT